MISMYMFQLPEENLAVVTRQVSKIWATIGTKVCNRLLIDPFEITFLLESVSHLFLTLMNNF